MATLLGKELLLRDGQRIRIQALVHRTRRSGWNAEIYRAVDVTETAHRFAVKYYHDDGGKARRAFEIGRRLDHPTFIRTVDLVESRFLVTEWVAGPSLSDVMTGIGYTRRVAWRWLLALGDALARLAVLLSGADTLIGHGDVQPSNVLLPDGATGAGIRLIDFDYVGLAFARDQGVPVSRRLAWTRAPGLVVLKPPEYALGTVPMLDSCSDVFSYGLLAYWLLSGRPPWSDNEEYYRKVLEFGRHGGCDGEACHPSRVWALREEPAGRVLLRMTAIDRFRRYRSMAEAVAALRQYRREQGSDQ